MKRNWEQLDNAVDLSLLLNNLLQEYYNRTREVNPLLEHDSEESLIKFNQILEERETIINQYNMIKDKYERLKPLASITDLDPLEEERRELLELIKTIDSANLSKANDLSDNYKTKIQEINKGKIAAQAYRNEGPLADGFFVDKRK